MISIFGTLLDEISKNSVVSIAILYNEISQQQNAWKEVIGKK